MLRSWVLRAFTCSHRCFQRINLECTSRFPSNVPPELSVSRRWFSNLPNPEEKMRKILSTAFPKAKSIDIVDVSGGCGAMYEIYVEAPQFKGLSIVKQHRLVTDALKEEIKDMHGLRIQTSPT